MKNLVLAALPLAMAAGGCATITRGAHQAFTVETEPSGAHVSTASVSPATPRRARFRTSAAKRNSPSAV